MAILFDSHVARIRHDTADIRSMSMTLAGLRTYTSAMDAYDLKASEANLREAADKIASIRQRLDTGDHT